MSPALTVIGLSAILGLLAVVAAMLVANARGRRQLAALSARVAEVEARLTAGAGMDAEIDGDPSSPSLSREYSADVLAGQSSYIAQLVSRSALPTDLGEQSVVAIYRHLGEPIRPSDLAEELHVSVRTLQRGVARSFGCTPNQLILTVKLREARRMLASGRLRVGEVAHRLAFADAAHLSRSYRTLYRCPPSQHLPDGRGPVAVN